MFSIQSPAPRPRKHPIPLPPPPFPTASWRSALPPRRWGSLAILLAALSLQASPIPVTWTTFTTASGDSPLSAMGTDGQGNVYALKDGHILQFRPQDPEGQYQDITPQGLSVKNLSVDAAGELFVLALDQNQTSLLMRLPAGGNPEVLFVGANQMDQLAISPNGTFLAIQNKSTQVIQVCPIQDGTLHSPTLWHDAVPANVFFAVNDQGYLIVANPGEQTLHIKQPSKNTQDPGSLIASMLSALKNVAVDGNGIIHAIDGARVLRFTERGGTYVQRQITGALDNPTFLGVNDLGTLRVGELPGGGGFRLLKLSSRFKDTPRGTLDKEVMRASFTFAATTDIASLEVLMKGAPNKAFQDAGTGSLSRALQDAAGLPVRFRAGDTATVDVTFQPMAPGMKMGAVVLRDSQGNPIATAYLQGKATGPQMVFRPSTTSVMTPPGALGQPSQVDVDGQGRLYLADRGLGGGIKRWDPAAPQGPSLINIQGAQPPASGAAPLALAMALDGAGNVYWGRSDAGQGILVEHPMPSQGSGTPSSFTEEAWLKDLQVSALAADAKGNLFYIDAPGNVCGRLTRVPGEDPVKEEILNLASPPPQLGSGPLLGLALDGEGNLFISSGSASQGQVSRLAYNPGKDTFGPPIPVATALEGLKGLSIAPSGVLFAASTKDSAKQVYQISSKDKPAALLYPDIQASAGVALAEDGSLFLSDEQGAKCLKYEAASAELHFPDTPLQPDNTPGPFPLPLTIANNGTGPLTFAEAPVPPAPFNLENDPPSLDPGDQADLILDFSPTTLPQGSHGQFEATLTLKVDDSEVHEARLLGRVPVKTSVIQWTTPPNLTFGSPIDLDDLNAKVQVTWNGSPVPGSVQWALPTGTLLADGSLLGASMPLAMGFTGLEAGAQHLLATFTPDDPQTYDIPDPAPLPVTVAKATGSINFTNSTTFYTGSPQNPTLTTAPPGLQTQLKFAKGADSFALGAPTECGTYRVQATLASSRYEGTAEGTFEISQATPTLTWAAPAPLTYGQPLGDAQLNATATVPGTFSYNPAPGSVLSAGSHTLQTAFTPTDALNQRSVTAQVTLQIDPATPTLAWAAPAAISYGQPLGSAQMNATASVPGTFTYSPAPGTLLTAGSHTLHATFTPADTLNQRSATAQVTLQVDPATPTLTWAAPTPLTYGQPLGDAQLNATASVPGTFTYTPASGTILPAGSHTLLATFTPADPVNQRGGSTAQVPLQVLKAPATIALEGLNQPFTGAPRAVTFTTQPAGLPVTVTYDGAASVPSAPGTYAVVATVSDPNHQGSASGTLTIAPAAPTGTLTLQATGNTHAGDPMILTATFSNPGAYPGAPVTFRDGATLLGQAPLVNGEATFKALDLPAGVHAFHATLETGNAGVIQDSGEVSTSILPAVLTLALESQALTVNPGETLHTGFTLAALGRATGPVHLSASGVPAGLTLTFSANDLDPTRLPLTLSVDLQASSTLALQAAGALANLDFGNLGTGLLAMGLLAAPFAGWRRRRRILPWLGGFALVLAAGLTGCHQGSPASQAAPAPIPPAPPTTYSILITAHADGMDDVNLPLVVTVNHGSSK